MVLYSSDRLPRQYRGNKEYAVWKLFCKIISEDVRGVAALGVWGVSEPLFYAAAIGNVTSAEVKAYLRPQAGASATHLSRGGYA